MPGSSDDEVLRACRRLSHSSIKQVADWIAGGTPPKHLEAVLDRLRANASLTDVTQAFKDLQEARERADYDHLAEFTRPEAHALVAQARRAVRQIQQMQHANEFRSFFGLVALKTSLQ